MIIGVPKEIKNQEYRVALVPGEVSELVKNGHRVLVEKSAGVGSGIADEEYFGEGAEIIATAEELFKTADLIMKVKEPLPPEYDLLREAQVLFTFLHLAAAPELTRALLQKKVTGIGYETVQMENGYLPLLVPMSEVAGSLSTQVGAYFLQKENGGSGVLLGGITGTERGKVTILGGGIVGTNAARIALGMGANVTVLDKNIERLRYLGEIFGGQLNTIVANSHSIESAVINADLVIGGVLVAGAMSPKLITRKMLTSMRPGSVAIDVAIDQGGCIEGSRPTSHNDPVFVMDGIIRYCVANMPSAAARTSTFALTNVTFPYLLELANMGFKKAIKINSALAKGLNTYDGKLTCKPVAEALNINYVPLEIIL